MDPSKYIQALEEEKKLIEAAIETFRALSATGVHRSRRGRKFMGAEERMEVSARMKKYWAARRRESSKPMKMMRRAG
jgi:hypothetical protein